VLGPVLRLTLERLQGELAARTRAAGQNISKRLGYAVVP
jgi:DNA-binding IclR family transcriptional regulator